MGLFEVLSGIGSARLFDGGGLAYYANKPNLGTSIALHSLFCIAFRLLSHSGRKKANIRVLDGGNREKMVQAKIVAHLLAM